MRPRTTNWNDIIDDFKTSELSMKEYCQKYGYTYYTFAYHKRKLAQVNNFSGFIEAKDKTIEKPNAEEKDRPKLEPNDFGFFEIKIKEITIKIDNKKISKFIDAMFFND